MVKPNNNIDKQLEFTHLYLNSNSDYWGEGQHTYYNIPVRELHSISEGENFTDAIKELGYDGVLQSLKGDEAVVFDPNQIKSATDNIGTYDGENEDIRFSKKFNRDNIAEAVYRNRMIIDYNRYVFENRPRGILKPHYGYIDEDRLEEYKAFYQDIKNKAEDLKSYLKEVIMTDATSGAKSFMNEYIANIDRRVDAYRRLSENDNSVLNEYLRFSKNNANQEVFVSNAQRAVEGIKQDKATPEQWLKMIEKQGGLKAGEDKWLGLSDWLNASDNKSITKQEILDFIGENKIEIEEVHYGGNTHGAYEKLDEEILSLWHEAEGNSYDKAEQVQNILNERYIGFADVAEIWYDGSLRVKNEGALAQILGEDNPINSTRLNCTTQGLENKREIALTVPTIESWNEDDDVHFGDAGGGRAVAWIRFGETTDSDGNSVLVIDEIQSKRHQEGREKGYEHYFPISGVHAGEYVKVKDEKYADRISFAEVTDDRDIPIGQIEKIDGKYHPIASNGQRIGFKEFDTEQEALDVVAKVYTRVDGVPSAPFEKNWHELAMKRMLRLAAEEGYDKVAWTKGEQQAERYNIGAVVERIESKDTVDYDSKLGVELVKQVDLFARDGNVITLRLTPEGIVRASSQYNGHHISDIVGKELGNRIMTETVLVLKEQDLRIGGEGMKGFYDEILPRFMNRYGKKWGTKVEDVKLPKVEEAGRVMHSVAVTEEMRESVMEGQVMFSKKRTAPETVSVHDEHLQTVVSSAVGAKVLNNIDDAIKEYGNHTLTKEKTFLGNLAKILNAKRDGSNSEYATFEAVNGKVFTIRLSDHNATVSNFDVRDEDRGISIVITAKDNKGITNDGDAHVTEYFYDAIKLRKADGKPLVEILKSVKQALYSGEYKDNTGLAEVREVNNTNGIDDTRFSRKMGEAKAQLADMKYGETVRMDALAQAKAMFQQGEPMEDIFAQTGWKQQNMFGKPTWIYTEPELSAREKLDRFLKADRKSEIEMLTLGNKKLSELRAMLGDTINMKTFKSKLQEIGKSEEEVREDLADLLETFGKSDGNLFSVFLLYFSDKK